MLRRRRRWWRRKKRVLRERPENTYHFNKKDFRFCDFVNGIFKHSVGGLLRLYRYNSSSDCSFWFLQDFFRKITRKFLQESLCIFSVILQAISSGIPSEISPEIISQFHHKPIHDSFSNDCFRNYSWKFSRNSSEIPQLYLNVFFTVFSKGSP